MKRRNWLTIGLLIAAWAILFGQPTALGRKLRGAALALATPFVHLADLIPAVHSRRELAREADRLRAENDRLRQQVAALAEQARENLTLRRLLSFKEHAPRRTVSARVIGRDLSNWWRSIQIDRGWEDGLTENLAVVTADGLIGRTSAVSRGESRVLLLLDADCRVSALLQDSRAHGIVSGPADPFLHTPRCTMTYVDRQVAVRVGEAVITSGFGGVFPKGLLIGHVERAQLNSDGGLYQDVAVRPAADFQRLEAVLVMLEERQ